MIDVSIQTYNDVIDVHVYNALLNDYNVISDKYKKQLEVCTTLHQKVTELEQHSAQVHNDKCYQNECLERNNQVCLNFTVIENILHKILNGAIDTFKKMNEIQLITVERTFEFIKMEKELLKEKTVNDEIVKMLKNLTNRFDASEYLSNIFSI